uniref:SANTA domain-containing protein n=1 Tax=Ciona savignyi TaxID=51511 RepID=H2YG88_CIOSA
MGEISCSNDSIQLGYSASVCGNDLYRPLPGKSTLQIFSSTNSVSGASFFSKPSTVANNKHRKRENLEKWKIEPVLGWNAVRLVGLRCRDKKLKHTSLIKWRMQSRCILTDSGSIYTLVGPMQRSRNIPDSIFQAFEHGFPNNWKQIVRDYLQIIHERNCGSSSEHESEFPVTNTVLSATLPDNLTEEPETQVILHHTPSNHDLQLQDILETPAVKRNKIKIIAKKKRNSSFNNSSHDMLETPAPKAKRKTSKKVAR